jgi:hypothetical protein
MLEMPYEPHPLPSRAEIQHIADLYEESAYFVAAISERHPAIWEALRRDAQSPVASTSMTRAIADTPALTFRTAPPPATISQEPCVGSADTDWCDLDPRDWRVVGLLAWLVVGGLAILAPSMCGWWMIIPVYTGLLSQWCAAERPTISQGVNPDNDR